MPNSPLDYLVGLIERYGENAYLGEAVTQAEHFLQAGTLAVEEGHDDDTVIAALLHDIGHLRDEKTLSVDFDAEKTHHGDIGAQMLATYFKPSIVEPIRLHVAAKRYLCQTESDYFDGLSAASVYSLNRQGGPMSRDECNAFEDLPWHQRAIDVRRLDDRAKVPGQKTMTLADFVPALKQALSSTPS